ncbi:MAG: hypothetical protein KDB63_06175 [Nocardioidaceae bacterium]|nr:hypothetical protein [Nocardioidaceae bacterium]
MIQPDQSRAAVRLTTRLSALLVAVGLVLLPGAALAEVPEGWSNPDPVAPLHAILVFLVGPIGLFALIWLLASAGHLVRDAKAVPSITDPAPESREVGLDALMAGRDDEPAAIEAGSDKD